jgi:hypothetical protein
LDNSFLPLLQIFGAFAKHLFSNED